MPHVTLLRRHVWSEGGSEVIRPAGCGVEQGRRRPLAGRNLNFSGRGAWSWQGALPRRAC